MPLLTDMVLRHKHVWQVQDLPQRDFILNDAKPNAEFLFINQ